MALQKLTFRSEPRRDALNCRQIDFREILELKQWGRVENETRSKITLLLLYPSAKRRILFSYFDITLYFLASDKRDVITLFILLLFYFNYFRMRNNALQRSCLRGRVHSRFFL